MLGCSRRNPKGTPEEKSLAAVQQDVLQRRCANSTEPELEAETIKSGGQKRIPNEEDDD